MPKGVWEMKRGFTRRRAVLVIALLAFAALVVGPAPMAGAHTASSL